MARNQFMHDTLYAKSTPMASSDIHRFGLFLEKSSISDLQFVLMTEQEYKVEEDDGTIGLNEDNMAVTGNSSPTLNFVPSSPSTTADSMSMSKNVPYCSRRILKNAEDVHETLSKYQTGLQVLSVGQEHSFAPLYITKDTFQQLLLSANIFEVICGFVSNLGFRDTEVEIAPPRFRAKDSWTNSFRTDTRGFEMVYGLRFVEPSKRDDWKKYSLRQCVIYNQKSSTADLSRWLFICMPELMHECVNHYLDSCYNEAMENPFDIHVLLVSAAFHMWRPYLVHLTERVDGLTKKFLLARPDGSGLHKLTDGKESRSLKALGDDILDAMLAIEAFEDTIRKLKVTYQEFRCIQLKEHSIDHSSDLILQSLTERQEDTQFLLKQLAALREKITSTNEGVASFLSLSNGHSLQQLAEQAHQDTEAVKALTVITLIYLPITVVLNFFSASFIDIKSGNIALVRGWWLFLAIGLPLTLITLLAWRVWIRFQGTGLFSWTKVRIRLGTSIQRVRSSPDRDIEKNDPCL